MAMWLINMAEVEDWIAGMNRTCHRMSGCYLRPEDRRQRLLRSYTTEINISRVDKNYLFIYIKLKYQFRTNASCRNPWRCRYHTLSTNAFCAIMDLLSTKQRFSKLKTGIKEPQNPVSLVRISLFIIRAGNKREKWSPTLTCRVLELQFRWDEWVPAHRVLKLTEENIQVQKSLHQQASASAASGTGSSSKSKSGVSKDGSSARAGVAGRKDGTRGTKRGREEVRWPFLMFCNWDFWGGQDESNKKPEMRLNVPEILKVQLVDDWENITKNNQVCYFFLISFYQLSHLIYFQLVPVPRSPTVEDVLEQFGDYARTSGRNKCVVIHQSDIERLIRTIPKSSRSRHPCAHDNPRVDNLLWQISWSHFTIPFRTPTICRNAEKICNRAEGDYWGREGAKCDLWSWTFTENVG